MTLRPARTLSFITLAVVAVGSASCKKPDAAPVDAAPPLGWCARQSPAPSACEDFDAPGFDPSGRVTRSDGDASLVASTKSGPNALAFHTTPADAAAERSGAWLMTNARAASPIHEVHVAFDLELGEISGTVELASVGVGSTLVTLEMDARGGRLTEAYMDADAAAGRHELALPKLVPRSAWVRVAIDLVAGARLSVTIDGAVASAQPLPLVGSPRQAFVIVGVRQTGAPMTNAATFDDVTLDVK